LLVHVAATARTLHTAIIEAANAAGPRRFRLLYPAAGQRGGDIAIGVDNGRNETAEARKLRTGILAGLAALFVLTIGAFGYLVYAWQGATDALAAAEQTEADLRKQMGGRGPQETAANRDLRAILERKKAQPPTVLALDELSAALPDDTWLTELQITEGQMRVSGTSQSVADLVPAVQEKPIFADATFFSPTTRLTNGAGDRFHLQMRLVPLKAAQ
jgi:general secretion pathway protein L